MMLDGLIGTWIGSSHGKEYTWAAWTLTVELFASFWVYLIAFVVINYEARWCIYAATIVPVYLTMWTDEL